MEGVVRSIQRTDPHQPLNAHGILADGSFEEAASAVCPTSHELDAVLPALLRRTPLEHVVHVVRVALQEAVEAAEQLLHKLLGVPLGVGEEHMVHIDYGGEEMALLTGLALALLVL